MNILVNIDYEEGHHAEAREHASQALKIDQELGDQHGVAISLIGLANIDYDEGRYAESQERAEQALKIEQELGDQHGVAASLHMLGIITCKYEQPKEAIDLMTLSDLILTQIGHADAQLIKQRLMDLLAEQRYTEEQQQELFQQVSEAYLKDGGREWIENALAKVGRGR